MPDVDFRMWCDDMPPARPSDLPPNVLYEGAVPPIGDLPLPDADAWLYTSGWDGVPSQLLQVAVTGIPIVGTLVGGVGEVLKPDGAWAVPADSAGEAYVAALRTVLQDPAEARRHAARLRERLLAERGEREFDERVRELLLTTVPTQRSGDD
jgi:glycosyltransferase involved in cell wall biosynthesis